MKIENLKDFIIATYVIIDDIYRDEIPAYIKERRNINTCKLSDSEIITISVVGELLTIDSEKSWVSFCRSNLSDLFPNFCHRTRFNRTRRALHKVIETIRDKLTKLLDFSNEIYRIVDSMPIKACHFGRAHFHKTFREYASYGRCASKKETYYGFKLHMLVSLTGYVTDFTISNASIDDRPALWELVSSYRSITVLGDKGYIGDDIYQELRKEKDITLIPLKRNNSKTQYPKELRQLVFKARRRIETTGSQLSCQLNIQRVQARSFWGLITRIRTKLLAHSICYYINSVLLQKDNISKIKELIFG